MLPSEWRAGITLSGVYALRMLGMFLVLPVLALHVQALGGSRAEGGMAIAAYALTQMCLQLPLGSASDRFGRKRVICLGLMVFAAGSFLAAYAQTPAMLVAGRALQGAGAVNAATTALLADLTRDEVRTRAMSMVGLSIGLAFAAGTVLSPLLTRWLGGVPGLFALTGVLCLAAAAVVVWAVPNPQRSSLHEDTQAQPGRIREILANGQLMRLNFGIAVLQTVMMAVFASLPFELAALGLAKESHWQIYLPAVLAGLVLMVPAIIAGETRGRLKTVFVSGIALVAASLCGLYAGLHSLAAVGAALAVYFVGFNILEASMPSMVSKIAPADLKGTAMGVYNTAQSVGVFAGGAAGGRLYQHFGFGGVTAFALAAVLLWLALAAAAPAPRPVKNVVLPVPEPLRTDLGSLKTRLQAVSGVEAVSFGGGGATVFIKALQQGFDIEHIRKILTGEQPCL